MTELFAKHHEPHGTAETIGTTCHDCRELSCISTRKRTEPWRYFCEYTHKQIEPDSVDKCERRDGR